MPDQAIPPPTVSTEQHIRDQLATPEQIAAELQVPVKTLYAWRYQRTGPPSFRVGKHIRYRRRDVDRWVAERLDAERNGAA